MKALLHELMLLAQSIVLVALIGLFAGLAPASAAELMWQIIEDTCPSGPSSPSHIRCLHTERVKVPGGWLVTSIRYDEVAVPVGGAPMFPGGAPTVQGWVGGAGVGVGLTFLPDPNHSWQP